MASLQYSVVPYIGIVFKPVPEAEALAHDLATRLLTDGCRVAVEHSAWPGTTELLLGELAHTADRPVVLVSVGGDGTFLRTARTAIPLGIAVAGLNLGRLGFLTDFEAAETESLARMLCQGGATRTTRAVLQAQAGGRTFLATNDVVINKNALSRMVELRVTLAGHGEYFVRADGIIVSTPTGSTAYNVSAGGPVLLPELDVVVLSPICPQGLGYRPLVVPAGQPITVQIVHGEDVYLTVDGQEGIALPAGERVEIAQYAQPLRLLPNPRRTFVEILRRKLHWGSPSYRENA